MVGLGLGQPVVMEQDAVLNWLKQGSQTFYILLDRIWDVDESVGAFDLVECLGRLRDAHTISAEELGGGDIRYTLEL